jgi:hypothetical protein
MRDNAGTDGQTTPPGEAGHGLKVSDRIGFGAAAGKNPSSEGSSSPSGGDNGARPSVPAFCPQPLLEHLTETREQYDIGIVVTSAGDGEFLAIP